MEELDKKNFNKYWNLLNDYISGNIKVLEFESLYLRMFKTEKHKFSRDIYVILAKIFSDVDAYCSDPDLRDESDLDEEQLLERVKEYMKVLNRF